MDSGKKDTAQGLPVLVIGSLNMDLTVNVCQLPQRGETVVGNSFVNSPGGKGANQAAAAAKLGAQVMMTGCVGQDAFAAEVTASLQQAGVGVKYIRTVESTTGIALITVEDGGTNTIVVVAGANQECSPSDVDRALQHNKRPGILLLQNEVPADTVEYAIRAASKQGWLVIYNPAPVRKIDPAVLSMVDILTPNETELAVLSGLPAASVQDAVKAAKKLLDMGVKKIVVTMGVQGSLLLADTEVQIIPAIKVKAVDSTAAGDCYAGALAAGLAEGKPLKDALKLAAVAAGLSVTKPGAQAALPWRNEVEDYMRENVVRL